MSVRKRSKAAMGKEKGSADNPIIAAIERPRRRRTPAWTLLDDGEYPIVTRFFDDETIYEIGTIVLAGLFITTPSRPRSRDSWVVKIVTDAHQQAPRLFRFNQEPELIQQAIYCMPKMTTEGRTIDRKSLEKAIEDCFYGGKPLQKHKRIRLRNALRFPALAPGAPRKKSSTTQGKICSY